MIVISSLFVPLLTRAYVLLCAHACDRCFFFVFLYLLVQVFVDLFFRYLLRCIQNCQQPTSISTRLTLETRCTGLFCGNIESYVWSVEYLNKSYAKWQKIANLDDSVLTYANSPNLVTREGKLIANSSYLVTVNGSTPNGHFSVTNYSFFTNTPPVGGSCSVDKSEGRAWETSFIFRCSGWRDDDLPLRYKFRYNTSDGIMMVFQSGPSSKATGKLPVGDENKDYNLHVQVQIFDARGSSAEWSIFVRVSESVTHTFR